VFGPARQASKPDLAIEVVGSSGGIDKLEIYRKLGVREVWYWQRRRITPYVLVGDAYEERAVSGSARGHRPACHRWLSRCTDHQRRDRAYRDTLK